MIIIDSSVAFKWFSQEDEGDIDKALEILDLHLQKKEIITVPDLIIYELANVWATKSNLPLKRSKVFLKDFQNSQFVIEQISFELINKAMTFSKKYKVSVYDTIYAVLAKEKKCLLITADEKFVEKINLPFVKLLQEYK
ncbi:MAG: Uncharacterized protein G01um10147_348 [Microgenomates group bacterium Gr01-1014_7]|nr:MAG: Uncharacterized protein G01um10147_348 [Microgenomates group bacterium Gr01-1014_7]